MASIIHTGDLHFDRPFTAFPFDKAAICREEKLACFERIINKARAEKTDILLLAGDLFENTHVSLKTVNFLKRCFASIRGTHIFIVPGNHDCISGNGIYSAAELGENVTVFGEEISYKEIESLGVRVYGMGLLSRFTEKPALEGFKAKEDGMANIMLLHGGLPPYDRTETNPIFAEHIAESGLDYLACGHIHKSDGIKTLGKTAYAYCGIPDGRLAGEEGNKGIICGKVEKGRCELGFEVTSSRFVHAAEVDVGGMLTYFDVINGLGELNKRDIYYVTLKGERGDGVFFDTQVLEQMLCERVFFASVTDNSVCGRKSDGILERIFIEKIAQSDKSEDIKNEALRAGLAALGGNGGLK